MNQRTKGLFREFVRESGGLSDADRRALETGEPLPPPRPRSHFREFLIESGRLSEEERVAIETDDAEAVRILNEGWDASDPDLREDWRLYERADLVETTRKAA